MSPVPEQLQGNRRLSRYALRLATALNPTTERGERMQEMIGRMSSRSAPHPVLERAKPRPSDLLRLSQRPVNNPNKQLEASRTTDMADDHTPTPPSPKGAKGAGGSFLRVANAQTPFPELRLLPAEARPHLAPLPTRKKPWETLDM